MRNKIEMNRKNRAYAERHNPCVEVCYYIYIPVNMNATRYNILMKDCCF